MSRTFPGRNIQYLGGAARPVPPNPALWTFQHKILSFIGIIIPGPIPPQVQRIYPPPGPLLAEWFMIEADLRNTDFALFGEATVQNFPTGPVTPTPAANCIATLSPGESLVIEPNDKGDPQYGFITMPDETIASIALTPDLDFVDLTQFYLQQGPTGAPLSFHCTIGNRSRR